jgi:hypothetical protein
MLKDFNITLSAEEALIEKASAKARAGKTTLEDEFRRWLENYVRDDTSAAIEGERRAAKFRETMEKLSHVRWDGSKLTREELNER